MADRRGGGAVLILCGILCRSCRSPSASASGTRCADRTGDPWDGRTLEWITASPPPAFNFAALPNVKGEEAYWGIKQRAIALAQLTPLPRYEAIEMPVTLRRLRCRVLSPSSAGFALIWHIWWMAAVGVAGAFATFVVFAWRDHDEYDGAAEEVARIDAQRREARVDLVEGREPGIRLVKVSEKDELVPRGPCRAVDGGPAPKRIVTAYGFWVFLLSDFVMFSGFYAAYAVLSRLDGGRSGAARTVQPQDRRVRDGRSFFLSSFVCGLAIIAPTSRTCCGPRSASS